jgi:hypothetical protein
LNVSIEDLQTVAQHYLNPDHASRVVVTQNELLAQAKLANFDICSL